MSLTCSRMTILAPYPPSWRRTAFGSASVTTSPRPLTFFRFPAGGWMPTGRPNRGHLEPRLSLTAAKADEWIPIRPGTEGTVALGIAHVMVREGLYDRDFVERHGFCFEDL